MVNLMMRPGNKIIVLTEWLQPLQGGGNLVVYTQVSKGQCFGLPMDHPEDRQHLCEYRMSQM